MEERNEDSNSNLENSTANVSINSTNSSVDDGEDAEAKAEKNAKLFPIFSKTFRPKEDPLKSVQLDISKTNPTRKRKRVLLAKETDGLSQMLIDAGQKEIGPKFCEECGLLYSPGDFDDEEEHRKAHLRLENAFAFTLWKDTRILFTYTDGSMVIMVQCNADSKRIKNRLRDFLAWLDSELGGGYEPAGSKESERIFLYVVRTKRKNVVRILGCGIVELPEADKVIPCDLTELQVASQSRSISIGITRLWTDPGFRNKGIASKIVELMRFHSGIPGCVIPKSRIGILEPSDDGRMFMIKYTESEGASYTYKF